MEGVFSFYSPSVHTIIKMTGGVLCDQIHGSALQRSDLRFRRAAIRFCDRCPDRAAVGAGLRHHRALSMPVRILGQAGGLHHPLEKHLPHRPGYYIGGYPPGGMPHPQSSPGPALLNSNLSLAKNWNLR